MTHPSHEHTDHNGVELPPELAAMSAALDDLALAERDAAPRGLADRVYFRTASSLRSPGAPRRAAPWINAMRIAAVLGLIGAGAIGVSQLARVPSGGIVASNDATKAGALDELLPDDLDAWNPIGSTALTDVASELQAFETSLDAFWSLDTNWLDEESL